MFYAANRTRRGFTLTELAIVLAVVGVLAAGLYNLISNANQQTRDTAAANQQSQLIEAVKGYLNSQGGAGTGSGQLFLQNMATNTANLPLPSKVQNAAGNSTCPNDSAVQNVDAGICNFLPTGFYAGTINSYSQTYSIRVYNPSPGTAPASYSFMILTTGGSGVAGLPTISDTSGARISSLVGGDGGFVYTNNVCGTPVSQIACGSYGAWALNIVGTYGFSGSVAYSGSIASRSFIGNNLTSNYPWLDRYPMPGDSANAPVWNTMSTNLVLGTSAQTLTSGGVNVSTVGTNNAFFMGAQLTDGAGNWFPSGGGTMNVQGGTINMSTFGATTGGGTINLQGGQILGDGGTSAINITNGTPLTNGMLGIVTLSSDCSALSTSNCVASIYIPAGDISVPNGYVNANTVYASYFIYGNGSIQSDIRLKSNIRPLSDSLDNIMRLKPVSYNLKSTGKPNLGVVAQDVEKVYPQLVMEGPDGMKAVNYDGLIAPLIDAVQELKKENDQLRQQMKEQTLRQEKLERELKDRSSAP